MRYIFTLIGLASFALGIATTYKDVTSDDRPWHVIGEIWFNWAPTSLQISESIISRYVDPCGLFVSIGCEPFLWHPVISTVLQWYASPSFILFGLGLLLFGRYLGNRKSR